MFKLRSPGLLPILLTTTVMYGCLITIRAHAQNLYITNQSIANSSSTYISEFTDINGNLMPTGQNFVDPVGGTSKPGTIAFDKSGNLFEASRNGNIYEYTNTNGTLSSTSQIFATPNSVNGLDLPNDLVFDSAGNLFVSNYAYNGSGPSRGVGSITEFSNSSGVLSNSGSKFAQGLNGPVGLAFDKSGNLYVTDSYGSSISKFSYSNGSLNSTDQTFATNNSGDLVNASALVFDSSGNLFVGNVAGGTSNADNITEFTTSGGSLDSATGSTFATSNSMATFDAASLAFDSAGNLFTGNPFTGNPVSEFTYSNGSLSSTPQSTYVNGGYLAFGPALLASPAPEPSELGMMALIAIGLGGLMLRARKRTLAQ